MPYFAKKTPKIAYFDNYVFHSHVFVRNSKALDPEFACFANRSPFRAYFPHAQTYPPGIISVRRTKKRIVGWANGARIRV